MNLHFPKKVLNFLLEQRRVKYLKKNTNNTTVLIYLFQAI